ncbi:dethiobiotin synthase [Acidomonas methanolica]|uniref:dethiobiotin synthase n=1 Tax=Acidomonas methanolica TaxID=437 RepID=UPI00211A92DD|nr:dethiobiotin synthase [Acidomonas methanolica]MCQ9156030.1 dethiobiotin synthase [Acidomonas methanolica]
MTLSSIAGAFDAAEAYESEARVQAQSAALLAAQIARAFADTPPRRILEFGCGTGMLTARLRALFPDAEILATDISPRMLDRAARRLAGMNVRFAPLDAGNPEMGGRYDLVCSNFCLQWIAARADALQRLSTLLEPGGRLMVTTLAEGSFREWRAACAAAGTRCAFHAYPSVPALQRDWPSGGSGGWESVTLTDRPGSAFEFLRGLKRIGAALPAEGARPDPSGLRHAMAAFDRRGEGVSYEVAFGAFRRAIPPRGVFVTGTDTGVGKTLASAVLARAWGAHYWKPLQSGLADEPGDTPTVAALTGCVALPPAYAFSASLSPLAAAEAEGVTIDPSRLALPANGGAPLVVEGAGGLMVPVTAAMMMIDLAALYGMPVILVARSGLGTINHTLLSLEALRRRGLPVAGVILNGPANPGNRAAIERFGAVRVLAELPWLEQVDAAAVASLAERIPPYDEAVRAGSRCGGSSFSEEKEAKRL